MQRDFTLDIYRQLLKSLVASYYTFLTYERFSSGQTAARTIILRHDVDDKKQNSLRFAKIQNEMDLKGTYYFRTVPRSYDEAIIREIYEMGHEIGYHYETMDTCGGKIDEAYNEFCRNLEKFRRIVPVSTICMHGSPLSRYDNRDIWKKYNYRSLGILAEPYFDLDFNTIFYITDTGRRWDGEKVSIRDKAMSGRLTNPEFIRLRYRDTFEVIRALNDRTFPSKVMMTFHPQRWTDNPLDWYQELVFQNVKNFLKRRIAARQA